MKFFLRKSSKNAPATKSFQKTAGYDEFAAGPPPTVGARPIRPSEQNVRKLASHHRMKSVGSQGFRQLEHMDSGARPRTAPGSRPPPIDQPGPSKFSLRNRASHDETRLQPKSVQGPPKVPELPKGLTEIGGPKYFDLLQAAVSAKTKAMTEATRISCDFYNESIADRNSLYREVAKLPVDNGAAKVSLADEDDNALTKHPTETQRASFDAARSSRNASSWANRAVNEGFGVEIARSFAGGARNAQSLPLSQNIKGQNWLSSEWDSAQRIAPQQGASESRRSMSNSARQTKLPPQLPATVEEELSTKLSPADSPSLSNGREPLPSRKRSRTVPVAPTHNDASDWRQIEEPGIHGPVEVGLKQSEAADATPFSAVSHTSTRNHKSSASREQADYVPPRISSNRSGRKRESNKNHSIDSTITSIEVNSEGVLFIRSASRKINTPSRTVMDLTVDDRERKPVDVDNNDSPVGFEETSVQQADPVRILHASVVSGKSYAYKDGDSVMVGKFLPQRPSRELCENENTGLTSVAEDVGSGIQPTGKDDVSASNKAPSPRLTTSDRGSQTPLNWITETSASSRPLQHSFDAVIPGASTRVSSHEPAEARTSLPKSGHPEKSASFEVNLPRVQSETTQQPPSTSVIEEALPFTVAAPSITSPAVTPGNAEASSPGDRKASVPPSPGIMTRDFAHSQAFPRVYSAEATGGFQSRMTHGTTTQTSGRNKSSVLGGCVHIKEDDLEHERSELDRSITAKKQAAAQALLRLQEVMAMPTWEEISTTAQARASTKVPSHWRGLSIEDGGPIAPNAIFQKVKIPILAPPLPRQSTFRVRGEQESRPIPEVLTHSATERALAPSLQTALNNAPPSEATKQDIVARPASPGSPEGPSLEQSGRRDTAVPKKGVSHARMGSAVSASSETSAYGLPYHMVPTRGSSMRE